MKMTSGDVTDAGYERPRGNYDPLTDEGSLTIKLSRLVPVRGRVLDEHGEPAEGIDIAAVGKGRSMNEFRASAQSDSEGRYELLLAPNQIYLLGVKNEEWAAAPQTGFAVFPDKPVADKDFQLRKPTRVQGVLSDERTREPIANQRVIVYQYGLGLHEMEGVELPNPKDENYSVQPILFFDTTTDMAGGFEFSLGDGKFDIRPPQQEKAETFEIAGEEMLKIDVTTKLQAEVQLSGLIRNEEDGKPMAGAKLIGVPRTISSSDWSAESDDAGNFAVRRLEESTCLYVFSLDKSLSAFVEVAERQAEITIDLKPVGSVTGRLVNEEKEPVAGQKIKYGVRIVNEGGFSMNRFGGRVVTDAKGEFELQGLAGDWEYELSLPPQPNGGIPQVTKVTVKSGESKKLGDVQMPKPWVPYVPPTLEEKIENAFGVEGTPVERYARALKHIKLANQHLLIVFGKPNDRQIKRLMDIRFNDAEFRPFRDEFRFMAIPTDDERLAPALELAEQIGEDLPESKQSLRLVIFDQSGETVASKGIVDLTADGELSKDALFELLRNHLTQPLDARELLDEALKRAAQENKRVIVQETATWCGPCHQLSNFLDGNRVWEKDYIWIKMDHRWTGAKEVMGELRGDAQGGIPWIVILDAKGEKLATSNDPKSGDNIGFPSDASGQVHFAKMLNQTRQRMTDAEVADLIGKINK